MDTVILKKRDLVACGCNDTVKSFVKLRELAKVTRHAYKIDIYICRGSHQMLHIHKAGKALFSCKI